MHILVGNLLLAALLASASQSWAREAPEVSVDALKRAYLACSVAAEGGSLAAPDIWRCSVVYEELKRRAFDGDFLRLLAWSRAQALPRPARR